MALLKCLSNKWQQSLINQPEMPLPNLNSANIFLQSVWGQTAKFKDRQYFQLYGMLGMTFTQSGAHERKK